MNYIFQRLLLVILTVGLPGTILAQISNRNSWKKRVYRVIDMKEKDPEKTNHLRQIKSDTLLINMLEQAIYSRKLTIYMPSDPLFSKKVTPEEYGAMIVSKADTIMVVDPITGEEVTRLRISEFDHNKVQQYRVLEDWTFDPERGKTEIQIIGLAPVLDVYGDDGIFRGQKVLFWVKYNDAVNVVNWYDRNNPENTFGAKIWSDYFQSEVKPDVHK